MHQLPLTTRRALSWGLWKTPVSTAARLTPCTVRSSSLTRGSPMFSAACSEKEVQYKQVSIETMLQMMASGQKPPAGHNARALYGEFEQAPDRRAGDSFVIQHLREVAIDHQNGVFAGTNDLVETIGGRPATTLEAFI